MASTATMTTGRAQAGRCRLGLGAGGVGVSRRVLDMGFGGRAYGTRFPYGSDVAAPLAFVTDFGSADTYAAALVAACWRVDPGLHAIVGMHGVSPGDVLGGAYHVK